MQSVEKLSECVHGSMNGYHVKKLGLIIAGVETKMCTQNYHELLKAAAFDSKLCWGHRRVCNTGNRFGGHMSGRMM